MALTIASAYLDDDAFLAAFHACRLLPASFRHGDHLRLAWLMLHTYDTDRALSAVRAGIRRFAAHHGVAHIFHETVTGAWIRLLATHDERDFATFVEANAERLNQRLLLRFWTEETLNSPAARSAWVPPDRMPLPAMS